MAGRTVSPSTMGTRPTMRKMFDGKGKTRPIPVIVDTSELRAIAAAAADSTPKLAAVNWPTTPRVGPSVVFGTKVTGATRVAGGIYNPAIGADHTI